MNERIKQLIKQAGGLAYDDDNNELTPMLVGKGLEKFAELIVTECADCSYHMCKDSGPITADLIKIRIMSLLGVN